MSDEHNHNDPLERLFRKKAEEYDISYREEDWLKLEKKLDARDTKIYYQRRFRWLAAASILIISLIGFYTVQNHNKINELTEQLNQSEQVQPNEQLVNPQENLSLIENETAESNDQANEEEVSDESEGSEVANEYETTVQDQQPSTAVNNDSELIATVSEDESTANQSEHLPGRIFDDASQTIPEQSIQPNELFPNRSSMLATVHSENQRVVLKSRSSYSRFQTYNGDPESGASAIRTAPLPAQNGFSSNQSAFATDSRFAVGIVLSPDLSTAGGMSNFDSPGFKGGVMAEYAISKNFSVISGIAISNVKYKADGDAYNPPQAWNYGVMPDRTSAVCVVLDIPINLKANLFNFDRSRIYTTAGLSSYIMVNEDYQFQYDRNQQGLDSSWSDATGTRHWFSNAGFSIGVEYDLSKSWSVRAEPHIKVPLKGVGWGDVELYSFGNFLSLNYRFSM
ncbi:MAG: outer membrane beta-barrel protein [Bacteroidetes bacterium]|jgi:hypothetical protein|nr:outer membrane beta-barrel protein [Bacteroidota bacterium]